MTQFDQALAELNIEILCANSNQAKGRVERANRTLQDRLVKELRLAGVSGMEHGNAFLPSSMDRYSERYAMSPVRTQDLHGPLRTTTSRLNDVLCHREQRYVGAQLTFHHDHKQIILEQTEVATDLDGQYDTCVRCTAAVSIFLLFDFFGVRTPSSETIVTPNADIRQVLDGQMRPDTEVLNFEHSERLYPSAVVHRGTATRRLPLAQAQLRTLRIRSNSTVFDLFDYLANDRIAGLLILKNGKVVLEDYELGLTPSARWTSWSMAKSVSSTLIGVAIQQGLIHSLDDTVSRYVPILRGSAYDHVSIRNVLRMSSGVAWDETYSDPQSDCRKLADQQLQYRAGTSMAYMASRKKLAPQGTVWNYNSGEANIPGAILEAVTHKPLAQYLSETLWIPLGMESDATWWTESPGGLGLSGVGIGATLRDYARFGLFVEDDGVIHGQRIVPKGWFREAGSAQQIGGKSIDYGLFWWPLPAGDSIEQGAFQAIGIFGQHLYINPREKLVIVVLSARSKPVSIVPVKDLDAFNAIAHALDEQ